MRFSLRIRTSAIGSVLSDGQSGSDPPRTTLARSRLVGSFARSVLRNALLVSNLHRREADFPISMIPNGVSVLRSRAPVYPMHDEEVGLIEGKESGSLLVRQYTSGRSLRSTFLSLRFVPRLDGMRVDDCPN
jgi:hypothetical protein